MFEFDIAHLFPRFLLNDRNGYAMAKAIEAGLKYFLKTCQDGLDCVQNVEKMPEWRLDEMAWELNCLYDFHADVGSKRKWIRDAIPLFASYGTTEAINNFLTGYFDDIEVEEYWQYGGDPFHFRVTLSGEWTDDREAWARRAIATSKNVRSVLDSLAAGAFGEIVVNAEQAGVHGFQYPMTSTLLKTGTRPRVNTIGVLDDSRIDADAEGQGHHFPYPITGTKPDVSTMGFDDHPQVNVDADATGYPFPYNMPGENKKTGTWPDVSTMGEITQGTIHADNGGEVYAVPYKMCGRDTL